MKKLLITVALALCHLPGLTAATPTVRYESTGRFSGNEKDYSLIAYMDGSYRICSWSDASGYDFCFKPDMKTELYDLTDPEYERGEGVVYVPRDAERVADVQLSWCRFTIGKGTSRSISIVFETPSFTYWTFNWNELGADDEVEVMTEDSPCHDKVMDFMGRRLQEEPVGIPYLRNIGGEWKSVIRK